MYIYPFPYSLKFIAFLYSIPRGFLWIFGSTIGILGATKKSSACKLASTQLRSLGGQPQQLQKHGNLQKPRRTSSHVWQFLVQRVLWQSGPANQLGKATLRRTDVFFKRIGPQQRKSISLVSHTFHQNQSNKTSNHHHLSIYQIYQQLASNIQAWKKPPY